jgi:hypothetical protein
VTLGVHDIPSPDGVAEVSHPLRAACTGARHVTPTADGLTWAEYWSARASCGRRDVDETRPTPDELAVGSQGSGVDLSDKLHLQTVRLKTASDVGRADRRQSDGRSRPEMAGQNASLHPSANALGIKPAALRLVHDTGHVELRGLEPSDGGHARLLVGSAPTPRRPVVLEPPAASKRTRSTRMARGSHATDAQALQLNSGVTLRSGGRRTAPCRRGIPTARRRCVRTGSEASDSVTCAYETPSEHGRALAFTAKADGALLTAMT